MPAINSGIPNTPPEPTAQFARRSILLIVGNLVKLAVQLAVIYLYSRILSVTDYGRYQSIWLYVNVFSVIGLFGLPSILLSSSTAGMLQWIRGNRNLISILFSLLFIGPLIWILSLSTQFSWLERSLLCSLLLFQNMSIIAETLAIKKEQERKVLVVNIFFNAGYLIAHLWVVYSMTFSLMTLLAVLSLLHVLKALVLLKSRAHLWAAGNENIDAHLIGKQWLYLGLYDVVAVLFKWVDKWIILVFISVGQFAVYYNGSYEIPVFMMLASAVGNVLVVEFAKSTQIDAAKALELFKRSSLFLSSLMLPAFCFLLFFHEPLFLFVFSEKYEAAVPVFFASIFIIPVRMINHTAVLQVYHKNNIIFKGAVIDLFLAIALLAILYRPLGLPGVALAFVLSSYVQAGYYLKQSSTLLKIPMGKLHPFGTMAGLFIFSLLSMGGCYMLCRGLSNFYSLMFGLICTTGLALGFFLFFYKKKYI